MIFYLWIPFFVSIIDMVKVYMHKLKGIFPHGGFEKVFLQIRIHVLPVTKQKKLINGPALVIKAFRIAPLFMT